YGIPQFVGAIDDAFAADAFAGTFPGWFDDGGVRRDGEAIEFMVRFENIATRHVHTGGLDEAFRTILIKGGGQGERIGAAVRDAEHLQHGRHARLTAAADAVALGDVEYEVRQLAQQAFEQFSAVAEQFNLVAQTAQRRRDGLDGDGTVEFFLEVV